MNYVTETKVTPFDYELCHRNKSYTFWLWILSQKQKLHLLIVDYVTEIKVKPFDYELCHRNKSYTFWLWIMSQK